MDPDDIKLESLTKNFNYTKTCLEIDKINDIEELRMYTKSNIKLYMKQQEVLSKI